jgi:hypothetical protein
LLKRPRAECETWQRKQGERRGMRKSSIAMLATLAMLVAGPLADAASDPIRLSFEKCPSGAGVWAGTVAGDVTGTLTTRLTSVDASDGILHVNFDWIVGAGTRSFRANLDGILSTETGRVVMNGTVVEGWLEGAQVHEEGLLAPDLGAVCFRGSIRLMPATAG